MPIVPFDAHLAELEQQARTLAVELVLLRQRWTATQSGRLDPDRPPVSAEQVQRELTAAQDNLRRTQAAIRRLLEDLGPPPDSPAP